MSDIRPHDYLKSRSIIPFAIKNFANATDRSISIAMPTRDEVPMSVEHRLTRSLTNVGANVHGIATGFAFDTINLLTKKDSKCIQIIAIALGKVI
jgi:hypothetical protein|tara:strand:- start:401 stop:685 length:285 start_codon:yes stop_codon:yes gene_type:complete